MLAKYGAGSMETVETVRVSQGAFRPVAFSGAITETTVYEYDPDLPGRVVYEDGEFVQVPPFARPGDIALPEPFGTHTQYIIPHSETLTLFKYLQPKGVRLVEVRGTWPPANMRLMRALCDFGFMRNEPVDIADRPVSIMEAVSKHLQQSSEGRETLLYGYALHVELEGQQEGGTVRNTLTHTHPPLDGTEPQWAGLQAYTRNVGIPFAIAGEEILEGRVVSRGVSTPEEALAPENIFDALKQRGILIHERVGEVS